MRIPSARRRGRRSASWSARSTGPAAIARRWSASSAATRGPPAPGSRPSGFHADRGRARGPPAAHRRRLLRHRRAPGGLRRAHPLHPAGLHSAHPRSHPARPAPAGHHRDLGRGPRGRVRAPARRDRRARAARGPGPAAALVSTRVPLTSRRWYHVAVSVDLVAGTVSLRQTPLADHTPSLERPVAVTAPVRVDAPSAGELFSPLPAGASRVAVSRPAGTSTARSIRPPLGPRPDPGRARGRGGGAEPWRAQHRRHRDLGSRRRHGDGAGGGRRANWPR